LADETLFTCTILKPDAHRGWLSPAAAAEDLKQILSDQLETEFAFRQVSKAVNWVKNNSPDLITET
jgi:putative SOS response-associated peptidase YedK